MGTLCLSVAIAFFVGHTVLLLWCVARVLTLQRLKVYALHSGCSPAFRVSLCRRVCQVNSGLLACLPAVSLSTLTQECTAEVTHWQ